MEVNLTGTEINALRELVEEAIIRTEKQMREDFEPRKTRALKEKRDNFRQMLVKLPVEFGTVA